MKARQNTPSRLARLWQNKWIKNLITLLLILIVYLSVRPFFQGNVIKGNVPMMRLETIDDQLVDVQKLLKQGQPVLIHFWASWCPICKFTQDNIENIAKDYPVISIATQSGDDQLLLDYAIKNGMNPSIIINDYDGKWMQHFGAKAVPADFIINPNGQIEYIEVGFTSEIGLRIRLWLASLGENS